LILSTLVPYLSRYERFNISLTSRLTGARGLVLPNPSETTLYAGFTEGEKRTAGVVMITRMGSVFPLLDPEYPFSPGEISSLLSRIISPRQSLFSLLGTERDVRLCWPHLNREMDKTLTYYLMVRDRERSIPPSAPPRGVEIRRLTPRNCGRVFPLEERYQHEEVLVHPERYNRAAHMLHFKRSAARQHILFAETAGGPVAKAGTNSIGMGYCQIGGVYTLPAYRRMGLSRTLMHRVLTWARDSGLSAALFVQKHNRAAVELYRDLSFDVESDYRIIYMKRV
jgi:predicted GNAT family acetyltransferase